MISYANEEKYQERHQIWLFFLCKFQGENEEDLWEKNNESECVCPDLIRLFEEMKIDSLMIRLKKTTLVFR